MSIPESFSTERISSGNYVSIVPAKQVGKATGLQLFITLFWCSTGSFGAILIFLLIFIDTMPSANAGGEL